MRIGVSLCCAKAGARPAANENAAAPATKRLRVWPIVLSCPSHQTSVRLRDTPPRGAPHRLCIDNANRTGAAEAEAPPQIPAAYRARPSAALNTAKFFLIWKMRVVTTHGQTPGFDQHSKCSANLLQIEVDH